jgi:hypothetical protein
MRISTRFCGHYDARAGRLQRLPYAAERSDVPVLFLTALSDGEDKLPGMSWEPMICDKALHPVGPVCKNRRAHQRNRGKC